MSETPEQAAATTGPIAMAAPPPPVEHQPVVQQKPNRIYLVAAWVAIVAGAIFIVAVIFFSGFVLGKHSYGSDRWEGGHRNGHSMMMEQGGPQMGPMMRPGFVFGPGPGLGNFAPGGPGQPPQTTAPTR